MYVFAGRTIQNAPARITDRAQATPMQKSLVAKVVRDVTLGQRPPAEGVAAASIPPLSWQSPDALAMVPVATARDSAQQQTDTAASHIPSWDPNLTCVLDELCGSSDGNNFFNGFDPRKQDLLQRNATQFRFASSMSFASAQFFAVQEVREGSYDRGGDGEYLLFDVLFQ